MDESFAKEQDQDLRLIAQQELASGDDLDRDMFPQLYNLSSGWFFQFMPQPLSSNIPEFVYIPLKTRQKKGDSHWTDCHVALNKWNMSWEASQLRHEIFEDELPAQLKWIRKFEDANIYLLPDTTPKYEAYIPLYHLLPQRTLQNFNLPLLKRGIWPPSGFSDDLTLILLQSDFETQLSEAFAHHVWPLLIRGSKMKAFTKDDPIVLLSHSLNYWLPYVYCVAEERVVHVQGWTIFTLRERKEAKIRSVTIVNTIEKILMLKTGCPPYLYRYTSPWSSSGTRRSAWRRPTRGYVRRSKIRSWSVMSRGPSGWAAPTMRSYTSLRPRNRRTCLLVNPISVSFTASSSSGTPSDSSFSLMSSMLSRGSHG